MRRLARVTQQLFLALLCAVILSIGWSSVAQAEAPLACAEEMKNNPVVMAAIEDAWEDSRVNDKDKRHEEGGWILQNIETGELAVIRVDSGTRDELEMPYPPYDKDWRVVGTFHTHPSPRKDEFGKEWEPGPSDTDINTARSLGLPGLIRNVHGAPDVVAFGPHCPSQTPPPTPAPPMTLTGTWKGTYKLHDVFEEGAFGTLTTDTEASITMHVKQKGQDVTGIIILSDVKSKTVSSDPDIPIPPSVPAPRTIVGTVETDGGLLGKFDSNGNLNLTSLVLTGALYTPSPYVNQRQYASASISGDSMTFNFGLSFFSGATLKTTYTGSFTVTKVSDRYDDSLFP